MELSSELQQELAAAIRAGEGAAYCVALSVGAEAGLSKAEIDALAEGALAQAREAVGDGIN